MKQSSNRRRLLFWQAAAVVPGPLLAVNPFYQPDISLRFAIFTWFADMALALILAVSPVTARLGILVTGAFFAIPAFLSATPLARFALMVFLGFPFIIATAVLSAPPTADYKGRLAFFFSWLGTKTMQSRPRGFDVKSLLHLVLASAVFMAMLYVVKGVSAPGFAILGRWLACGIGLLAFAEMVTASHDFLTMLMGLTAPSLMRSPALSTSINEFWTRRWNIATSELGFRALCFAPLARRGVVLALFAAFFASALVHMLLCLAVLGRWRISVAFGAFFLVQPLLVLAERRMNVRCWPTAAARLWTLSALAVTCPLFVEPVIQFITPTLRATNHMLSLTALVLSFTICGNLFFSVGQFLFCPKVAPANAGLSGKAWGNEASLSA